jgi:hypothetical protein
MYRMMMTMTISLGPGISVTMMMMIRRNSIRRGRMSIARMKGGGRPVLIGSRSTLMMSMMKMTMRGYSKGGCLEVGLGDLQDCSLSKRAMIVDLPIWKLGQRFTCQNSW